MPWNEQWAIWQYLDLQTHMEAHTTPVSKCCSVCMAYLGFHVSLGGDACVFQGSRFVDSLRVIHNMRHKPHPNLKNARNKASKKWSLAIIQGSPPCGTVQGSFWGLYFGDPLRGSGKFEARRTTYSWSYHSSPNPENGKTEFSPSILLWPVVSWE